MIVPGGDEVTIIFVKNFLETSRIVEKDLHLFFDRTQIKKIIISLIFHSSRRWWAKKLRKRSTEHFFVIVQQEKGFEDC